MAAEEEGNGNGADHPRGQEVFFQYKRELYIALVEKDGRLAVPESDKYETPSEFANDMVKRYNLEHRIRVRGSANVNGWQACTVSEEISQTLQELLDMAETPRSGHSPSLNADERGADGDRKRKRLSNDTAPNTKDDYRVARALRRRRTTRLAVGTIKQVDYKFTSGTGGEATAAHTSSKQRTSGDSGEDTGAELEHEDVPARNGNDVDVENHPHGSIGYDDEESSKLGAKAGSQFSSGPDASSEGSAGEKQRGGGERDNEEGDAYPSSNHGWDLEEQELLLDWLQSKGVLDANVLAEDSLGRDSEDIKKFLDGVHERMKLAGVGQEPNDVKCLISFLAAEVTFTRAALTAKKEQDAQRKGRTSKEVRQLKKKIEEERSRKNELEKLRKKRKRELEESRSRLETEMQQRREIELERSLLKMQANDARREEKKEQERCKKHEMENEELREREKEAKNQLEESRLKILSFRAMVEGPAGAVPIESGAAEGEAASLAGATSEPSGSPTATSLYAQEMNEEDLMRLRMDVRRLQATQATLRAEIDDWKSHLSSEKRRYHFILDSKNRLEQLLRLSSIPSAVARAGTGSITGPSAALPPSKSIGAITGKARPGHSRANALGHGSKKAGPTPTT